MPRAFVTAAVALATFAASPARAVEEQVVVRQAEKNGILPITLAIGEQAAQPALPGRPEEPSPGPPYVGFALAGAGLVGGVVALVVGLGANADVRSLRDTCAP